VLQEIEATKFLQHFKKRKPRNKKNAKSPLQATRTSSEKPQVKKTRLGFVIIP